MKGNTGVGYFWAEVGEHKRDINQYTSEQLRTLKIYSLKGLRGESNCILFKSWLYSATTGSEL